MRKPTKAELREALEECFQVMDALWSELKDRSQVMDALWSELKDRYGIPHRDIILQFLSAKKKYNNIADAEGPKKVYSTCVHCNGPIKWTKTFGYSCQCGKAEVLTDLKGGSNDTRRK